MSASQTDEHDGDDASATVDGPDVGRGDTEAPGLSGFDRAPPDAAAWSGVSDALFARVVAHARRGLQKLDQVHSTPEVKRLRAIPTTKLAKGGGRRRLVVAMAKGGPVWLAIRTRLETDPELLVDLASALGTDDGDSPPTGDADLQARRDAAGQLDRVRAQRDDMRSQRDDMRAQRDRARQERDEARAQRDGAVGREGRLQARVAELEAVAAQLGGQVDDLTTTVADGDEATRRAVERERRRAASRRAELDADLTAARRDLDRASREVRRLARARGGSAAAADPDPAVPGGIGSGATVAPSGAAGAGRAPMVGDGPEVVVPGRPSWLPSRVRLDTSDGALELLGAVGVLLVDGYNVTRTQRPDMSLERQRRWLVDGVATLAARLHLDATIVFDAHGPGASGPAPRRRGVTVDWSHPGVSADDELVLAVEAMEPTAAVVVVTDDRELRTRLAALGADLLHTNVLAWLL